MLSDVRKIVTNLSKKFNQAASNLPAGDRNPSVIVAISHLKALAKCPGVR